MVVTVSGLVLSVWTANGAFVLSEQTCVLLSECFCTGRAEVLLQCWKSFILINMEEDQNRNLKIY